MGDAPGDTIFALSSGKPPCAVAVVRVSGPRSFDTLKTFCGRLPQERYASLAELRVGANGELIDRALVLRFSGPASSTGENVVEYQCHGSRAVVDRLLAELGRMDGLRIAQPGEFTRRALENGRIDLTQAEGLADLLEAESEHQRRAALEMADGAMSRQVEAWRARLVELSARAEAAIDYVGDEDETALDVQDLGEGAVQLARDIGEHLARPRAERLREGIRVVLAGPPNSGKSSLLNVLTESDRAIVTDIAGTTRDTIEVPVSISGEPLILVDTAGVHESRDPVEQLGIARAQAEAARADILLWLGSDAEAPEHPNLIKVAPKKDLLASTEIRDGVLPISSHTGEGIDQLSEMIVQMARGLLPPVGQPAINARQAEELAVAQAMLMRDNSSDVVLLADALRQANAAFDRLTGRSGVEDMLDALFGRFCLGK